MSLPDLELLRQSTLVRRVLSVWFDGVASSYGVKARVELQNGWLMDYWEHHTVNLRRYSFHVFDGDRMVIRWDNAPHHPGVSTFPHHRDVGSQIEDSEEMDVTKVLAQLESMI